MSYTIAASVILAFVSIISAAPLQTRSVPNPHFLHDIAVKNGKLYFGSATDQPGTGEVKNHQYQSILNDTRMFGQITPANSMKGAYVQPELGVFDYQGGDVAVEIAKKNGKLLRCHNLIWYKRQPDWLTDPRNKWTRDTLLPKMKDHIQTIISHWSNDCHAWDVVNEAFDDDGKLSDSPWLKIIGPDYVELAFKYAHDAVITSGKEIKLYYNDFYIESPGPKTDAVYKLIKDIKSKHGFTISVGLESHFKVGDKNTKSNQVKVMKGLQDLGATFAITELDVRFPSLPPSGEFTYQAQALRYWETVSACMEFKNCEGITVWDFLDTYSWVPKTFPGAGEACLYSSDFTQKPAYQAVVDALQGKPCSVCE